MVRGSCYGILYISSSFHSSTTRISSSYFHKVHVWAVLRVVRGINNGVNQITYILLECLIPVWDFHGGVAGKIKHKNCWQSKCVLNYCALLCICVRFYRKQHVGSIQPGVWTHQIVSRDQWRANTTVTQNYIVPNTHMWKLSSILQPRPLEVDGNQWWASGSGRLHPIFVFLTVQHSISVKWNQHYDIFIQFIKN
jgi:hypothetical protein